MVDPDDLFGRVSAEVEPDLEGTTRRAQDPTIDLGDPLLTVRYDALIREYHRSIEATERQIDRVLRIAAIGFSGAGALLVLVINDVLQLDEWALWLGPILLTLLFSSMIWFIYFIIMYVYYTRDIEDELASLTGITNLHITNTLARAMGSYRTGYYPFLANQALIIVFCALIYYFFIMLSILKMFQRDIPVWRVTLFMTLQFILSAIMLWGAVGITASLHGRYNKWITIPASESSADSLPRLSHNALPLLYYVILPKPFDFCAKSIFTIAAIIFTAEILATPLTEQLLVAGVLVVICVEFLAKQATYLWNHTLDFYLDAAFSYKKDRATAHLDDPTLLKVLFLIRTFCAIGLAILLWVELDLFWLPWLVLFIFVLQFVYDRVGKVSPQRRLAIAAFGYSERAMAGALTAMAVARYYDPVLVSLLVLWYVACNVTVLGVFWGAERSNEWQEKRGAFPPSTCNIWFLGRGHRLIEQFANASLFVIGLSIAYIYVRDPKWLTLNTKIGLAADLSDGWTRVSRSTPHVPMPLMIHGNSGLAGVDFSAEGFLRTTLLFTLFGVLYMAWLWSRLQKSARTAPDNRSTNRTLWILISILLMFVAWRLVPLRPWIVLVVMAAPIFLTLSFASLTFDEMMSAQRLANDLKKRLLFALDQLFFRQWAIRVAIRPAPTPQEGDSDVAGNESDVEKWLAHLQGMYQSWALSLGDGGSKGRIHVMATRGHDGGGEFDLLLEPVMHFGVR